MATHAYLCHATFEDHLISELKRLAMRNRIKENIRFFVAIPGVVIQENGPVFDPVFARQVLPRAEDISSSDHEAWIQEIFRNCPVEVQDSEIDWTDCLHVFAPDAERQGSEPIPSHFFDHLAVQTKKVFPLRLWAAPKKCGKRRLQTLPVSNSGLDHGSS